MANLRDDSVANVLRQASALLSGSALPARSHTSPILSQPQEGAPVVRHSSQQMSTAQVRQSSGRIGEDQTVPQLQETVQNGLRRCLWAFCLSLLGIIVLIISWLVFLFQAASAAMYHYNKECDKPLKWYLFTSLMFTWLQPRLHAAGLQRSQLIVRHSVLWALFTCLPYFGIIAWGLHMVWTAETCPQTNPDLFYPTRRFIYFQALLTSIFLVFSVVAACGYRRMLPLINRLVDQPGAQNAVSQFLKIPADSDELISEEDGTKLACPICLEELGEGVIRTPCSHFYHEECLMTWCQNHRTCPNCRALLGAPDP